MGSKALYATSKQLLLFNSDLIMTLFFIWTLYFVVISNDKSYFFGNGVFFIFILFNNSLLVRINVLQFVFFRKGFLKTKKKIFIYLTSSKYINTPL